MKKVMLILLLALATPAAAVVAQNIALGEKVPEMKVASWLGDRQPQSAALTYIEFFHSSNPSGIASVERLKELSDKLGARMRVIVLTREDRERIAPLLEKYLSPRLAVGFDPSGRIFTAFGVTYLPFGVLTDAKMRALWLGNSLQLTPELIEKSTR